MAVQVQEKELRPSQRKDDPEAFGTKVNMRPLRPKIQLPAKSDVADPALYAWLEKLLSLPPVCDVELLEIREQLEGGKKAIGSKYFQKPASDTETSWLRNKKLLAHVNLIQPVVDTYVNAVYSDDVVRTSEENPYKAEIQEWLDSDDFEQTVEDWAVYKVSFGTSVAVPTYDPDTEEKDVWMPDPVHTRIFTDPRNIKKVIAVAEILPDRIQYIHLKGEGVLTAEAPEHEDRDFGWLPVAIGYGIDLRSSGRIKGLPRVRDAYTATLATTAVMFNIRLMQKQQTRSLLKRIGDLEEMKKRDAGRVVSTGDGAGSVDIPTGGDADYITPDPKIEASLKVLRQQVGLLATAGGVPADVLDPTLTESSSSAEGARIRFVPYIKNGKRRVRQCVRDERGLTLAMTGCIWYHKNGQQQIPIAKLKRTVKTFIGIQTSMIPMSPNEETQDIIAKVAFGLMTPEDGVKACNGKKTIAQIKQMAAVINKRMEQAGGGPALEQQVNGGGRPPAPKPPAPAPAKKKTTAAEEYQQQKTKKPKKPA